MTERQRIDVVVPAYNEESGIGPCLDSILAQDYPPDLVRVYVVDAGSEDATAEIVQARALAEPRIRLLSGPGRLNAGEAFNLGYRAGEAPLVARVDGHSSIAPDYLSRAAEAFVTEDGHLACVGGQPDQVGETPFGRGVAAARGSRFGVGNSVYAERRDRAYVATVQAGVYRRSALDEVGGFATTMLVGEDEEVNWRLRRAGWTILLDRSLRFRYTTRSTWRAVFRQHRHYGESRARVIAAHPEFVRPRHLAPAALVVGSAVLGAASLASSRARRTALLLSASYACGAAAAGRRAAARSGEPENWVQVSAAFTAMHLGYGVGLVAGAAQVLAARLGRSEPARVVRSR